MVKTKSVIITGAITIGVGFLIIIYFSLISLGVIQTRKEVIKIETLSRDFIYDGSYHTYEVFELISGELFSTHRLEVSFTGKQKNAGVSVNSAVVKIYDVDNKEVTNNYEIEIEYGFIEVFPLSIIIETGSETFPYDGEPHSDHRWEIVEGQLVDGDSIDFLNNSSITDPGSILNVMNAIIYNEDGIDISTNYSITYNNGVLTIPKIQVTIITKDDEKEYDGEVIENKNFEVLGNIDLSKHEIIPNYNDFSPIVDVGRYQNIFQVSFEDIATGKDVSSWYEVSYEYGFLVITPKPILIYSKSESKVYDGTPLSKPGLSNFGLIDSHVLEGDNFMTLTDPGEVKNTYTYMILDANGRNVTKNYFVSEEYGYLTVITSIYDTPDLLGMSLFPDIPDIPGLMKMSSFSLLNDDYIFSGISDVSSVLYLRDKSFGDYNKTSFLYAEPYQNGLINPLNYPSMVLENNGYSSNSLLLNMNRKFIPYLKPNFISNKISSIDDVYAKGPNLNNYSYDFYKYSYRYDNYLTINNYDSAYNTYVYNNYTEIDETLKTKLLSIALSKGININNPNYNEIANLVREYITLVEEPIMFSTDLASIDVVDSFFTNLTEANKQHFAAAGVMMYRALGIPARYTIGFKTKVKANEEFKVKIEDSHVWAEVYLDGFGWIPFDMTEKDAEEITFKPVTMSKRYDGTKLTHNNIIEGFEELATLGYTYEAIVDTTNNLSGLGVSTIRTVKIYDENGNDISDDYDMIFEKGRFRISDTDLIIQTSSASKEYDGTDLVKTDGLNITGLKPGHTYQVVSGSTSSLKNPGTIANEVKIIVLNELLEDVTAEYYLDYRYGNLTVTEKELTITVDDYLAAYTGNNIVVPNNNYTYLGLISGHRLEVILDGEGTDRGISDITVREVAIYDEFNNDVTENYNINTINGELIIM